MCPLENTHLFSLEFYQIYVCWTLVAFLELLYHCNSGTSNLFRSNTMMLNASV